ncbi:MAG: hypothetical protein ACJAUG_001126 [Halioglobus sp.]|jgi:hypothetical protein
MSIGYKRMAGTSAVFLREDYDGAWTQWGRTLSSGEDTSLGTGGGC